MIGNAEMEAPDVQYERIHFNSFGPHTACLRQQKCRSTSSLMELSNSKTSLHESVYKQ